MRFCVLGLPRSATAWLANWLTTDDDICIHDPLAYLSVDELRRIDVGVVCTGLYLVPNIIDTLECPVLLVERPLEAVNKSLNAMGYPDMPKFAVERFKSLKAMRIDSESILTDVNVARCVWKYLRPDTPFNANRYYQLVTFHVEDTNRDYRQDVLEEVRSVM